MSLLRYVSPRGLFLQSCPLRILVQRQSSNRVGFFGIKKARARDIAPGSIKARDEADYDRITGANKDNRNLRGCRLGCRCRWSVRRDYRDFTAYKIGGHYLEAIILTPSPLVIYRDVLTLDITAFIESMEESGHVNFVSAW